MRWIVLVALAVFSSGCDLKKIDAENAARLAADDDVTCKSYGFQVGTDGYASCRMQVDQTRNIQAQQQYNTMVDNLFIKKTTTTCNGGYGSYTCTSSR